MGAPVNYLKNATTLRYDAGKGTGRGRCAEVCPHAVFEMKDGKGAITDRDRCMECGACSLNREFGALYVGSGVGCAAALIRGMITGGEPVCGCGDGPAPAGAKNSGCC